MSEFIRTRDPFECAIRYFNFKKRFGSTQSIISWFVKGLNIHIKTLTKQIQRQKKHYMNCQGPLIFLPSLIEFKHKPSDKRTLTQYLTDRFEKNKKLSTFDIRFEELFENQDQAFLSEINESEKDQYLNCLQKVKQIYQKVTSKRLKQFADEIFQEREKNQRTSLLSNLHKIMRKRYKTTQEIISNERNKPLLQNKKKVEELKQKNIKLIQQLSKIDLTKSRTFKIYTAQFVRNTFI